MGRKNYLLFLFLIAAISARAQSWQWAKEANSGSTELVRDVACDTSTGNIYSGGHFDGNLSAVYGASFVSSTGLADGFVAKYDPNGTVLWAIKLGGTGVDEVRGITVESSGNIYVSGIFNGTADFDPSAAISNLTSTGTSDGFLAKYTSSGTFVWAVKYGGTSIDEAWKVHCDQSGGIFITGFYTNSATFTSTDATTRSTFANETQINMFSCKYNTAGVVQWVISGGGSKDDYGTTIISDNNNIYVTGSFQNSFKLYSTTGALNTTLNAVTGNMYDVFVAAYTQAGVFLWATSAGSDEDDFGMGITQDATKLYITGTIKEDADFPAFSTLFTQNHRANTDIFLACLNKSNGVFQWVSDETGSDNDEEEAYSVLLNKNGQLVVTGAFNNEMDFSPFGISDLNSSGGRDVFLAGFDTNGDVLWSVDGGAIGEDISYAVANDNLNNLYIGGEHKDAAVFGTNTLSNAVGKNIFVAKYGCTPLSNNTISTAQTICSGNAPATLTGTAIAGGSAPYSYLWQQSPDNIAWSNASGTNNLASYSPPPIFANTYYRRRVNSTGFCGEPITSSSILITITPPPTTSAAGSDQAICATSATLSGNAPTTGTGTWTLLSGTGTITNASLFNSAVTSLGVGTNRFIWTIVNSPCPSSKDTVSIIRSAVPTTSNAGADQTLCSSSASLAANNPAVGTGVWSVLTGGATVTIPTLRTSGVTNLSTGTNSFIWTITSGVCPSSEDTVIITRDAQPTTSTAGSDQAICATSSTLNGNNPAIGNGTWTLLSGTGTISNASIFNSGVSSMGVGTNSFIWTIANGTCPSSKDTISIVRSVVPTTSNAGPNQTLCSSSASLAANNPTTGTGAWTVLAGGATVTSPTVRTSGVTNLAIGTNSFIWTIASGACPSSKDTVIITRDALPTTSTAGSDQAVCATSSTLTGNNPAIGNGTWTLLSGTGIISNPSLSNSTITSLGVGTNSFIWTIANGICPSSTDTISIIRSAVPTTSIAGSDQAICATSSTLSGNNPVVGNGVWSVLSGAGTFTDPNLFNTTISSLGVGTNKFIWTISNGACPSSKDTMVITRSAIPTSSVAGNDQSLCSSSGSLSANVPVIGNGSWQVIAGSSVVTNPAVNNSSITSLNTGNNSFVWTISNGTCPPSRDTVAITVYASPTTSNAGADQTHCNTSNAITSGNPPIVGTGMWTALTGTGSITSPSLSTTPLTGLSIGNSAFIWTISNGVCPVSRDTMTIRIDALPDQSVAGNEQGICSTTSTLDGNNPLIGSGTWSLFSGSAIIANPNLYNSPVNSLGIGNNRFVWTISNGVCPSSSDTVLITRSAMPTVADAGADQSICSTSGILTSNTPIIGNGAWQVIAGSGSIANPLLTNTSVSALGSGTNSFVWSISNGTCPTSLDTVNIMMYEFPSTSNAGTDQIICASTSTLSANTPVIGNGNWSLVSGSGSITNSSSTSSQVSSLNIGANNFVWTISNGVCPPSQDTVEIMVNEMPSFSNAGNDQSICATSTGILNAATPGIGSGNWSVLSGGSTLTSPTQNNSGLTGLSVGDNLFSWTIINGVCPPSIDTVLIHIDALPTTSNAGNDQTLCDPGTITLNANVPSTGTGQWTTPGTSTITDPFTANTNSSGVTPGNSIFIWNISNGVCPSSADTVVMYIDAHPDQAIAGNDQVICNSLSTVNANTVTTGTGLWTGIGSAAIVNPNSANTNITNLNNGINLFVWTVSNGVCPSVYDTVSIQVDALPSLANAGNNQVLCSDTILLSGNIPQTGTGTWSLLNASCTFSNANASSSSATNFPTGQNNFIWTISNGVCPPSVDTVSIQIDARPDAASAGNDMTICSASALLSANAPTIGTGTWLILSGNSNTTTPGINNAIIDNLDIGQNILRWKISNGVCADKYDDIIITRDAMPDVSVAGEDLSSDIPVVQLNANSPLIGSGTWTVVSGSGTFEDPTSPTTNIIDLGKGDNVFKWSIQNGVCPASADEIKITLNPLKIPNGFSPNDDGVNDEFVIPTLEYYSNIRLSIFNRWGNIVYETSDYKNDWKGKNTNEQLLADDTYYYILEVEKDTNYNGFIILKTGK